MPGTKHEEKEHNKPVDKHLDWLDLIRCAAICCVILAHTTERVYQLNADAFAGYYLTRKVFAVTLFTIGRIGVPLFFLISGYLLLDRDYEKAGADRRFYRRNLLPLLLTTEIWIVLYNFFNVWFYKQPLDVARLLRNMFFVEQTQMSHMWYMPVILGIYLFLPVIARGLQKAETKIVMWITLVSAVFLWGLPMLNVLFRANDQTLFKNLGIPVSIYFVYILFGYLIKKGMFRKVKSVVLLVGGAVLFGFVVWEQIYSYSKGITYNVWYDNFAIAGVGICLFVFLARIRIYPAAAPKFRTLANCSFGIYLIHNPVNLILVRQIRSEFAMYRIAAIFCITFGISFLVVFIVSRYKKAGRLLFHTK